MNPFTPFQSNNFGCKAKKNPASKPAAAAPAAAAPAAAVSAAAAPAAPAAATTPAATTASTPASAAAAPAPSTSTAAATSAPAAAAASASDVSSSDDFPAEVVNNLKALGFPDSAVRACLRAANGNPDVAVEFLMNGIPPGVGAGGATAGATAGGATSSSGSGGGSLDALRSHPQFDDLRRLVQSNPNMLQAVLAQIGQQQPELLQEINANQAAFIEMMNEPVAAAPAVPAAPAQPASNLAGAGGAPGRLATARRL